MRKYKPMLPTLGEKIPESKGWVYEVKYDGFRCISYLYAEQVIMESRNGNALNDIFPEVHKKLGEIRDTLKNKCPIVLDGELCILDTYYRADFLAMQKRGRLKNNEKINSAINSLPATFLIFDILQANGIVYTTQTYIERKSVLYTLLSSVLIFEKSHQNTEKVMILPYFRDYDRLWSNIKSEKGEGIIAKRERSVWSSGLRTQDWIKIKNLKKGCFVLTSYDESNGFFKASLYKDGKLEEVVSFTHGLSVDERNALIRIVKANQIKKYKSKFEIKPGIVIELTFLEWSKNQVRHPKFNQFRFDLHWEDCTWERATQI